MRAIWRRLPRAGWTYKLAKGLTRSVLRPEATSHVLELRVGGRFAMHVDLSDIVGNDLYCMDDHYEASTLALWRSLAPAAETILDLGSHIGLFACVAAATNPGARVVAVEALDANVRLLKRNAAQFPNLTPVAAAIGVTTDRRTFRISPITGGGYVEEGDADRSSPGIRDRTGEAFVVDTIDLVELCVRQAIGAIDLMKIDLEGLEERLLGEQDEFWTRAAPRHVIVEMTLARSRGKEQRQTFRAMERRGYRSRRVERLYTLPWFRREDLANWYFWKAT